MAFGKNPQGLRSVGSFRQTANTFNQNRNDKRTRTGGNATPSWVNEYKPPTDDVDLIRIIQGDYTIQDSNREGELIQVEHLAFFPYVEHYDARSKRRSVCSAGPFANDRKKAQPCHGCDLFFSSMKVNPATGKRERGFMGKRDMAAWTVLHYAVYHKIEQVDNYTGQVRMNERTNQPYYNWVRCAKDAQGKGMCDACDANKESKFGHRLHWSMGTDHYNTLIAYDEDVGHSCSICGGQDTIRNDAWLCANPECGDAVIDDRTRLSKKDIEEIVNRPAVCPACGFEGFLRELVSCVNCTPLGKTPKRATIFDVDLKVRRVESQDSSNRTTLQIIGHSDPRPIDKRLIEFAKPEDLNRIYGPTDLQKQATLFQVQGAPQQRDPSTAARPYGQNNRGGPNYG